MELASSEDVKKDPDLSVRERRAFSSELEQRLGNIALAEMLSMVYMVRKSSCGCPAWCLERFDAFIRSRRSIRRKLRLLHAG